MTISGIIGAAIATIRCGNCNNKDAGVGLAMTDPADAEERDDGAVVGQCVERPGVQPFEAPGLRREAPEDVFPTDDGKIRPQHMHCRQQTDLTGDAIVGSPMCVC